MNKNALYSDGTINYVEPSQPKQNETVSIRFRTAKNNMDRVYIIIDGIRELMELEYSTEVFDYYIISVTLEKRTIKYSFLITMGSECVYFDRFGVQKEYSEQYLFEIVPGFATPDWAKGAVMYQIYVDRFCNGDTSNDVLDNEYYYIGGYAKEVKKWDKIPDTMGVREFYGGDLQGVWDKLDYLEELGVEVLYLNPIFVSPSNHKYDIQDYDYIDPHYGRIIVDEGKTLAEGDNDNANATKYQSRTTDKRNLEASNQFFADFVKEVHARGMKIILDGVFNHCGSFNKWMDRERVYEKQQGYEKGAYIDKESPYRDFFHFHDEAEELWPYNGTYDGWWGHDTLPKLNYEGSENLEEYIIEIGKKWVSEPYNVDGWRLDVAADLGHSNEYNHGFWEKFRAAVKEANPDALILAEHYGNPYEWLRGNEWDTVMNYDAFMEPVTWFLTGMEKHSDEHRIDLEGSSDHFVYSMRHHMAHMLTPSLQVAMNELSNHDHSRFLTRTNHMVGRIQDLGGAAASEYVLESVMRIAVVIQMTWIGAPTIYYGDEAGVCGFTDPDNRRTYPWGQEDKALISFHKEMIRMHKEFACIKLGSVQMLTWEEDVLAYGRYLGDEQIVVVVNNSKERKQLQIPVWKGEVPLNCKMRRVVCTYADGYTMEPDEYIIRDGYLVINIGGHSAIVMETIIEEQDDCTA